MAYEEIRVTHPVAKNKYSCEWCGTKIESGEKHLNRVYKYEGDFNNGRMHLDCETAMNKSDVVMLSEGWMPGDFKRGEVYL